MALAARWLPRHSPYDPAAMAQAVFLEKKYWDRFALEVQNAIAHALGE